MHHYFLRNNLLIINTLIDNAEDLDIVMPKYNLLEYNKNYRKTTGSLWNYYKDEPNNPPADDYNADPITNSYKFSITGKAAVNRGTKEVEFAVLLEHLSTFWRTLDMPLINCEVSLTLTWSKNCVMTVFPSTQGKSPEITSNKCSNKRGFQEN